MRKTYRTIAPVDGQCSICELQVTGKLLNGMCIVKTGFAEWQQQIVA